MIVKKTQLTDTDLKFKEVLNLTDACCLFLGLKSKPSQEAIKEAETRDYWGAYTDLLYIYEKICAMEEHFYSSHKRYESGHDDKILTDSDQQLVNFARFVEWAYSEGEIIPNELQKYSETYLSRPLEHKPFGRLMQFYEDWASKGYWTLQESVYLLIDCDPETQRGKAIPTINNSSHKHRYNILEEMNRASCSDKLVSIISSSGHKLGGSFRPQDVIEWAKNNLLIIKSNGYSIPKLLLEAVERLSVTNANREDNAIQTDYILHAQTPQKDSKHAQQEHTLPKSRLKKPLRKNSSLHTNSFRMAMCQIGKDATTLEVAEHIQKNPAKYPYITEVLLYKHIQYGNNGKKDKIPTTISWQQFGKCITKIRPKLEDI